MSTYLRIKAALLPLLLFSVAATLGWPATGAGLGLAFIGLFLFRLNDGRRAQPLFIGLAIGLVLIMAGHLLDIAALRQSSTGLLFAGLAAGAGASLAIGRPWTAEFSAAQYAEFAQSQLFAAINRKISALWAVLFGLMAGFAFLGLPQWASLVPAGLGGLVSVLGPKVMMRRGLSAMAAGDRRNDWPAPDFSVRPVSGGEYYDVAVVGAGLGGLTAAALLAESGLKVGVFEQHNVPGGFAHTWLRRVPGRDPVTGRKLLFRFDSGVHDISGWHEGGTINTLFRRLGIADRLEWVRLNHRYVFDGLTIDVPRDWRAYVAELGRLFPDEQGGIETLFDEVHAIYVAMFSTAAEHSGVPGTPSSPERLLAFAKAHPLAVQWMDKPWDAFVSRHVRTPELRRVIDGLAGYITVDAGKMTVANFVPIFGYYFEGGYYPKGGSGGMAAALVEVIERFGGEVHLRTPVRRILIRDGAACGLVVADARGETREIAATAVISNADARTTFASLVDDPSLLGKVEEQCGQLLPSCSAVSVALGLRGTLDLPPLVHVKAAAGPVGIVIPSVVDPACAPEGYSNVELMTLVDNDEARDWFGEEGQDPGAVEALRNGHTYEARKRAIGDMLIERARQVIPDIAERILLREDASPVTYQRYCWSSDGAIYGVQPQSGSMPVCSPTRNLAIAGAATHGAGVEAVVISGALAAAALRPGLLDRRIAAKTAAPKAEKAPEPAAP
jgi:all-trans-retinol 13,14-reductase